MILLDTGMRNMPDKCSLCNFYRVESQMYCTAVVGYTTITNPYKRRPAWCPLHEVTDSDTISRKQAIDALFEIIDIPKHAEFLYTDEIARALDQLPPSPSRPQWIPCSERLPEECGNYFVSGGNEVWICEWTKNATLSGWVNGVRNPVIDAWMPLPEPYHRP